MGLYGSAPQPPDPKATAEAQFNYNMGSTQAGGIINNPNTYDPYGQTNYSLSGYETVYLPDGTSVQVPRYNQVTTLTQEGQRLLDQKNYLGNQAFNLAAGSMGQRSDYRLPQYRMGYRTGPALRGNFSGDTGSQTFMQDAIGRNMNLRGNVADRSFNPLMSQTGLNSFSGLIDANQLYNEDDFNADRVRVENAVYGRGSGLIQQDRDAQNARLAAQGIAPGTERSARTNETLDRSLNDLAMQAVLAGGQEQSRMLGEGRAQIGTEASLIGAENQRLSQQLAQRSGLIGMENDRLYQEAGLFNQAQQSEYAMRTALIEMENARNLNDMNAYNAALNAYNQASLAQTQLNRDQASFFNTARGAILGEREALKNADINRLQSIITGTQVNNPNMPSYFTQGVASPDYTQMVNDQYAAQVGAYNNRMGGISGIISGLSGFAPFLFGASSKNFKHDIVYTGATARDRDGNEVPWIEFTYNHDIDPSGKRHEGVFAEDLAMYNSRAVVYNDQNQPVGVDYGQLEMV